MADCEATGWILYMGASMSGYKLVEKDNPLALHGLFDTLESAQKHLRDVIPVYVAKGFFTDETLTKDSFMILETSR